MFFLNHFKTFIGNYKTRPEQSFIVFQAYLGAFFIGLFGVWRLYRGDLALAAVDVTMVMMLLALAYFASRDLYFRAVSLGFIFVVIGGSWATLLFGGGDNLYWSFPVVLAIFYVMRLQDAFWVNIVGLVGLIGLLYSSGASLTGFIASYLLVTLYAFQFAYLMKKDNERLSNEASLDPLTGVGNRRAMDDAMLDAIESQNMGQDVYSLIMIDIDFFKKVNDDFGHGVGDVCLQRLSVSVTEVLPSEASLFRFGGEEFTVLCRMPLAKAVDLAERVRETVESAQLIRERPVTVSLGVAELTDGFDAREWLHSADLLLYLAKHEGRNRVCSERLQLKKTS